MAEELTLTVTYKGEEKELPVIFRRYGYTYQFLIQIEGREFIFERDEERQYRVIDPEEKGRPVDRAYIAAIVSELEMLDS